MYLSIPAWSRATIALAYASALILAGRYDAAVELLDDPIITEDTQALQWRQFVSGCVHFKTRRWPDLRDVTDHFEPSSGGALGCGDGVGALGCGGGFVVVVKQDWG